MIEIGGESFSSVADVRERVHNLLNNAPIDEPLSGSDGDIIQELFLHHPEAMEKIGDKEIKYFKVGKHQQAGARAFCIVRSDDSEETFSMKKCVSAWARTQTNNLDSSKAATKKKSQPKQKVIGTINLEPTPNVDGFAGLVIRFQRIVELHTLLGKEIEQIQNILADESNR